MARLFFAIASILGALSVAGGAFGAHALKGQLTETALGSFETGIRYQMYHALALLLVALLIKQSPNVSLLTVAGWCFIAGTVLFSGSLYGLSLAGIKALGPVTPLGGVAFIAGWICLAIASSKAF
ncbi:MAG: DUF423 domain-containing protein [Leptolyngbya foveolarum]|uniref:DUF423 domain-containing protein n=1 Tax=Leptolyngbya foveolarum TaxID=47253 RepID=A0A2W4VIL1_9CYAN|nr:MAG: DUF423 domain-containing protein [Leptolyngbya foveolarum]